MLTQIIQLSDDPYISENEFVHSDFQSYVVAVLSELPNFEMNKKWEDVINRLVALKQNHELDYGEEAKIFRKIHSIDSYF